MFACICGGWIEVLIGLLFGSCGLSCFGTYCYNLFKRKSKCCGHKEPKLYDMPKSNVNFNNPEEVDALFERASKQVL